MVVRTGPAGLSLMESLEGPPTLILCRGVHADPRDLSKNVLHWGTEDECWTLDAPKIIFDDLPEKVMQITAALYSCTDYCTWEDILTA